jgi:hypothetical protein
MSVKVQFNDNSQAFTAKTAVFSDALMALMSAGIENKMKTSGEVPLLPKSTKWAQRGALRASIRHKKLAVGHYEVTVGDGSVAADYAAAQEAGVTRGHQIKKYSTAGTGAHFFQHAIDNVKGRTSEYITAARDAAGLR